MTWRAFAACADTDPEDWFPQPGPGRRGRAFGQNIRAYQAEVARLTAICDRCPVEADCLQDALKHDAAGIWGGTTAEQRRGMRGPPMTFTWTRDGEQITSTCPRCHAETTSRFPADLRRWQRSHTALACWRGRNRAVEGPRSDVEGETVHGHPAPTARPTAGRVRFTHPTEGDPA